MEGQELMGRNGGSRAAGEEWRVKSCWGGMEGQELLGRNGGSRADGEEWRVKS